MHRTWVLISLAYAQAISLPAVDSHVPSPRETLKRAIALDDQHRFSESVALAKQALSEEQRLDPNGPHSATAHFVLATIYHDWNHCSEATSHYARAVGIWRKQPANFPQSIFVGLVNWIGQVGGCEKGAAAIKLYGKYQDELKRYASGPLDEARLVTLRATISYARGHMAEAESDFRKALPLLEKSPDAKATDLAGVHNALSVTLNRQGHLEEGLVEARRAISLLEGAGLTGSQLILSLNSAGSALYLMGRKDESQPIFERSLSLARELFGEDNTITARIMWNYAAVLHATRQSPAAEAMKQKARTAYRSAMLRDGQTVDVQELEAGIGNRR